MERRHNPSGWILGWTDKNSKVHTKSIPITSQWRPEENAQEDAKTALLLLQLDLLQQEFETSTKLPTPMIAKGLTRKQVKQELLLSNRTREEQARKLFASPMIVST